MKDEVQAFKLTAGEKGTLLKAQFDWANSIMKEFDLYASGYTTRCIADRLIAVMQRIREISLQN